MRKLLIVLLVLITAGAALLGWGIYNLDSVIASYKDRIIAAAERRTGRKVAFERIEVKLRGGIGVRLRGLAVAEDPAFGSGNFLRAADVRVDLAIRPLERRVRVTRVVLLRPAIRIIRDARGNYNFSGLAAHLAATRRSRPAGMATAFAAPAGPEPAPAAGAEAFAGLAVELAVARAEIIDGTLDYRDRQQHQRLRLERWDLNVDDLSPDRPFRVEMAAAFLSVDRNLRFNGVIGPLGTAPRLEEAPVDGSVDIAPLSWAVLRQAFPRMDGAWPAGLKLAGNFQGKGLSVKGTLKDLEVAGTLDLTGSELEYAGMLNKPRATPLRIETEARVTPDGVAARRLDVTLDRLAVKGRGDLDFGSPAALELSLTMASTEMDGLERWIPVLARYQLSGRAAAAAEITGGLDAAPRIHGTVTLRQASARVPAWDKLLEELSATVAFTSRDARFRQLSVRIGATHLTGRVHLERFAPLSLSYRLASPSLRLADLGLPPAGTVLENARGAGRLTRREGLSWESDLTAARGKLLGLDIADLSTAFAREGAWLVMKPLRLKTFGGSVDVNGRIELKHAPRFEVAGKLRGIDIRQSLAGVDVTGFPELAGAIDADLDLAGRGTTWEAIHPTLEGRARAAVADGRILDFNLAERALRSATGMQGLIQGVAALFGRNIDDKYPHIFKQKTTAFEHIDAELQAVRGRIVVGRLALTARDYDIAGKGWVALDGDTSLDGEFTLSKRLSSDLLPGSRLMPITNARGQIEVPFTLRGTIPDLEVDASSVIQTLLEQNVVGRGMQGLLDLIPRPETGKRDPESGDETAAESGEETGEAVKDPVKDPVKELIERTLKLFGGER